MIVSNKGKVVKPENLTALTEGVSTEKIVDQYGAEYIHQGDNNALYDGTTISDKMVVIEQTITRPANANPYSPNDVIGLGALVFANISTGYLTSDGQTPPRYYDGSGYITKLLVKVEGSNLIGKNMRLYLFSDTFGVPADNVVASFGDTIQRSEICHIDFVLEAPLMVGWYSAIAQVDKIAIPYKTPYADAYGVLMTKDAFTPNAASSKIWLQLTATKNLG